MLRATVGRRLASDTMVPCSTDHKQMMFLRHEHKHSSETRRQADDKEVGDRTRDHA